MPPPAAPPVRSVPPGGIAPAPHHRAPAAASTGIVLTRDEYAAGRARGYVKALMADLRVDDSVTEAAVVITSELVTNAIQHGRVGAVRLLVDLSAGAVVITVADQTPYVPLPDATLPGRLEESGRGLVLVEERAARWGHRPVGGDAALGTAVWAEVTGAAA
jgi:anti-sigma regulatory factor (Ser/Thr protein kinase)